MSTTVMTCSCGARLSIPDDKAGQQVRCPRCASEFVAPPLLPGNMSSQKVAGGIPSTSGIPDSSDQPSISDDMKTCPFCVELIRKDATVCRYCRSQLSPGVRSTTQPVSHKPSSSTSTGQLLGFASVVLGIASVFLPYFAAVFFAPAALLCGILAFRQGHKELGGLGIVLAIVGLACVIYVSQQLGQLLTNPLGSAPALNSKANLQPQVVLKSEYDRVQEGMSYSEVVGIIGASGEEMSRSDMAGFSTVMYSWSNSNGSNMNAMFQNGKLINKAQFGLRQ